MNLFQTIHTIVVPKPPSSLFYEARVDFLLAKSNTWLEVGLLIGIGCVSLVVGLVPRWLANRSVHWPKVRGKIIESTIKERREYPKYDFWLELKYEYEVDGVRRIGRRRKWGIEKLLTRNEVDSLAELYSIGKEVTVHVHPRFPWTVLENTASGGLWFYVLFSFIFFVVAFGLLVNNSG